MKSIKNFFYLLLLCVCLLILSTLFCAIFIVSIVSTMIILALTCIDDLIKGALECVVYFISYAGFLANKTYNKEGDDENEFI